MHGALTPSNRGPAALPSVYLPEMHADGNDVMATIRSSALWGALAIFLLPLASCGGCPATPSITSISPNTATAGGDGLTLTLNGGNFSSNSVVVWNGTALVTTFASKNQLTAAVSSAQIAQPDTALVYVYSPVGGTKTVGTGTVTTTNNNSCSAPGSNEVSFTVSP